MAVYRVNKNRGYTVMANYHLRDKTLSLKAVGLLSKMLSFNDGWQFSTKGLSMICKEGPDAVLAALRELEDHGYLVRHRQRDSKGRMSNTVFEIYEQPQPVSPHREKPDVDNPDMENPHMENPHGENPAQLNTNQVITNERNNSLRNYQSINLDGMDRMDEREQYRVSGTPSAFDMDEEDEDEDDFVTIPKEKYDSMIEDLLTMAELIDMVSDMRTKDVRTIQEFGKFIPAYAAYERNRLSLYREAAKEAEDIIDRWEDELDDDEDCEPDEYFSD